MPCSAGYRDRDCRSDNRSLKKVQEEKTASTLKWSRSWPGMYRVVDRRAVTAQIEIDLHNSVTWKKKRISMLEWWEQAVGTEWKSPW